MSRFDITRAQARAWSILARAHRSGRVASTYLFYGREGIGQWPLAVEFAALLNCEQPQTGTDESALPRPCGECRSCRSIHALNFEGLQFVVPIPSAKNSGEAVDLTNEVLEIKRREPFALVGSSRSVNIPISMAREAKRHLSVRSDPGVTRVVVFYRMDRMRVSSADALLKLIEEPPPDTVIILTAERPEDLLPTIQSRAQKIRLERLSEDTVVDYLLRVSGLSESRAHLLARVSDGILGRALEMVQDEDSDEANYRAVGLLLFKSLCHEPAPTVVGRMTDMINFRDVREVENLLHLWQSLIRDCVWYARTGDEDGLINVDFVVDIERVVHLFDDAATVQRMVTAIKNTLADFRRNVHIQAALVAMVLELKTNMATTGGNTAREATFG